MAKYYLNPSVFARYSVVISHVDIVLCIDQDDQFDNLTFLGDDCQEAMIKAIQLLANRLDDIIREMNTFYYFRRLQHEMNWLALWDLEIADLRYQQAKMHLAIDLCESLVNSR